MRDDATKAGFARLIDHTALKPETTRAGVERLCRETLEWGFATSCIAPIWVSLAAELLEGSSSRVCTVVGFPHGDTLSGTKAHEAGRALEAGARELDMVIAIGLLKGGERDAVLADIEAVVREARPAGAAVKVILETSLLTDTEKILGCRLAEEAGADFVKTSTGFGPGGATAEDVRLFAATVGGRLGVKAAGGIRSLAFALALVEAGATRLGCSSSVQLMTELQRRS